MSRRLLVLLAAAAAVATGAAITLDLTAHDFLPYQPDEKVAQALAAAMWILAGLVAWRRRPDNRVGRLMTAVGFADLLDHYFWNAAVPFTLAQVTSFFSIPVAIHLFLAFPSGQLSTRLERAYVVSTYAVVLVFTPVLNLFWDPRSADCPQCPENLLFVTSDSDLWSLVSSAGNILLFAILLTAVLLLARRVRQATGATRRAYAPVLVTAAVAIVLLGSVVVLGAAGAPTEGSLALWLTDAGFTAIPLAFLFGLLRMQWHRSAVAGLVLSLGTTAAPLELRDAIARTLGDPSLELAFWRPDRQCFVNAAGIVQHVEPGPNRAVTTLQHNGRPVAALIHDHALDSDPGLVAAVGAAASLALENATLQAELRAQLADVRASRIRMIAAGDDARRRLERDLHDGAQQRLLGIRLALQLARDRLSPGTAVDDLLCEVDVEVGAALDELRALARGIHPPILTEEGLAAALGTLVRRAPLPVELCVSTPRLPASVEATAYFVVAEALANVVKHARASVATVDVALSDRMLSVGITDDGVGGADSSGGGLQGLRDRVEALDGHLAVDSLPGRGTRVSAAIPCE